MKTETRAFRTHAGLPAVWEEMVVHLARALGISLEIWTPASHHGQRLALGPACEQCERDDARTFDRCRKRRAYLTRPEVELPERLAERCPRRVRLSRRGATSDLARPLLFAFGHGIGDPAGESDAGISCFLGDVQTLMLPVGASDHTPEDQRLDTQLLFAMARCREDTDNPRQNTTTPPMAATELVGTLVTALEARRPAQRGHARRVRLLALLLGREVGLDPATLSMLHWAALLHTASALGAPGPDDGEACALDAAGGPLTAERLEGTRRLLEGLTGFEGVRAILRHHRTPPRAGDDSMDSSLPTPLAAGCLAVADALDILMAQQGPRRPRTLHTAIAALASATGGRFDAHVVTALQRLEPRLQSHAWIFLLHRHGTV